jgi:Zn-dependent alcohol dehydrogenase
VEGKEELKLFAPLGCGLQTGAASVLNRAQAKKGDSVAVIGLGGVGMAAIMVTFIQQEIDLHAKILDRQPS